MQPPSFLAVGHVTRDLLPDGGSTLGGTALFAALAARRLGADAALLSVGDAMLRAALPPDLPVALGASPTLSTFANRYGPAGREQWLYAHGAPIDLAVLPGLWRDATTVLLGPVAAECSSELAVAFPYARVGATAQGWLRTWQMPLPARVEPASWRPAPAQLRRLAFLSLSLEDIAGDEALAHAYAAHCPLVALTRGAAGATLYIHGSPSPIAPYPARERDPTGAGDVFAAALLVRLAETNDPLAAADFASAAAACVVEDVGAHAVPDRDAVTRRMAAGRSHGV